MKDFKVLKCLDKFSTLFMRLGINYPVMRKILQIKLIMDGRRVPTVVAAGAKEKEGSNHFIRSLWIYALTGAITVPFIWTGKNYIFQMSIVFGIMIFMVMTSLISDFTSVLLDIKDKNILFTRPVDHKTVNAAKMVHVLIYISYLTIAFTGIPAIAALVKQGIPFFLIFLAEIILVDVFIVVLTALIYLLVLRIFDGEKLKDIINYVQIALALVITAGYQLIDRLFSFTEFSVIFVPKWWQCFIIPVWFGAPFEVVLNGSKNYHYLICSILAIIIPVASMVAYISLIPAFERNLQKLNQYDGRKKRRGRRLSEWITKAICFTREERIFYRFASDIMKNEREFKLKVYPSLGLAFIFPFIFLFREMGFSEPGYSLNPKLCFNIYFCALFLPTVILMVRCSENYKGAWIYKAIPIKEIGTIMKGTAKAVFIRLFLPVYFIDCILFIAILGPGILADLIAILFNSVLFTAISFQVLKTVLPFSEGYATLQNQGMSALPLLFILGALGGIHIILSFLSYGVYIDIAVVFAANLIMWKKAFQISWKNL